MFFLYHQLREKLSGSHNGKIASILLWAGHAWVLLKCREQLSISTSIQRQLDHLIRRAREDQAIGDFMMVPGNWTGR